MVELWPSAEPRRHERVDRARQLFGGDAEVALDVLELTELAWHDCFGEITPPDSVIDDIWLVSAGDLRELVVAARLAVTDHRDLRMAANRLRAP